jgi:ATP/maltotriose-dependent transcriptional regulator MalT
MALNRWPLVGRAEELASVTAAIDACLAGSGSMWHVEAVAGSGKTFLLDHAVECADGRLRVRAVTLRDGTPQPYAVPLGLLGATIRDLGLADDGPRSFLEAGVGNATDALVVETLLARLEDEMSSEPALLVVDDLHLADPGSMHWLAAVGSLDPLPFVLLTAARPPSTDTAFGRAAPDFMATRTVLRPGPLTASQLDQLVEFRFAGRTGPRLRSSLAAVGGSPLVVTALLEALSDDDVVTTSGEVDIDEATAEHMRTAVPTAVASRVGAVAGADAIAVAAMALSSTVFDLDDVAAVLGVPLGQLISMCDRLKRAGLIVAEGAHRFRHEHYRLAAVALVDEPTRRSLHGAYARQMISRRGDPLQIADHLLAAEASGDDASEWLVRGAQQLVQLDSTAALGLIERAEEVAPAPDRRRTVLKARALANVGRAAESEALARHLLIGATSDEEVALRRDLAMVKFQQGRVGESSAELVRAAELASDERARIRLVAESSFAYLFVADFATARAVAAEASREGERVGDIGAIVAAEMVGGLVALYDHDLDEAIRLANRLEAFSELPEAADAALYQPWFAASLIRITLGEYDHARRLNGVGRRRSERAGYRWMVPAYDALDAYVAYNVGDLDDAEAIATSAIGWGIEDSFGATLWCHAFRALVAAARGEWEQVRTSIAEAEQLVLPDQAQFGWSHLALARTALSEHDNRPEEGYVSLGETWDVYEAFGIDSPRQELGPSIARLAHRAGDRSRLDSVATFMSESARRTGHPLWLAEATEVDAWRDADEAAMWRAGEMYAAAGRRLQAAQVMASAAELATANASPTARWYAARALEALEAVGATAVGRGLAAGTQLGESTSSSATSGVDTLSRSERAVVALVAEGLTNTQIAERLFLSRRTVESHVSAAYRKLQLSNRVELTRVVLEA